MAYLDNTGLAYFWGKIKAWANSVFALIGHKHPSSDVNAMTGYSMPASTGAISSGDTLNQAVGKLEKAVVDGDISNVVHRTGAETISGNKTFTNSVNLQTNLITRTVDNGNLYIKGSITPNYGSQLALYGENYNGQAAGGGFGLVASNGVDRSELWGFPNGVLLWANELVLTRNSVERDNDSGSLYLCGGKFSNHCGTLALYGKDYTNNYGGAFVLVADNATDRSELSGFPDGRLTWKGENLFNLVHKSGDEDIAGVKTFLNYCWFGAEQLLFYGNFAIGSALSTTSYQMISWRDSSKQVNLNSIYRRTSPYDGANDLVFTSTSNTSGGTTVNFYLRNSNVGSYLCTAARLRLDASSLYRSGTNTNLYISCGSPDGYNHSNNDGSMLGLYAIDYGGTGRGGSFVLHACNATSICQLWGYGNGTLIWNGSPVQVTSDERLKTQMAGVDDAFLDAWGAVRWEQFKFRSSVSEKGDSARFHAGLVAQHVVDAFAGSGLDACGYGILCHELRDAREWDDEVVVAEAYVDEAGVEHPAEIRVDHHSEEAVDLWMVRYEEALCMEAAYMRRENARLKKRVADLEERLAALELKIA